jgi:arylsulfatase A-like enzyme
VYVYGSESETPKRLDGYETDGLTNLFLKHLREHIDGEDDYQPFFAVLAVQPPHGPYVAPTNPVYGAPGVRPADIKLRRNVPDIPSLRERATEDHVGYYAMVENLDYNIGRIRQNLQELEIDRETYVIFFSDHGDMLWSHAQTGKSSPWEESIRVPFIVGKVGGKYNMRIGSTDALINHVDIAPTTLGLCGIPVPEGMVGHDYSRRCVPEFAPENRGLPDMASEPDSAYLQQIPCKMHAHTVNKAWRGVVMRDGWKYVCTPGNDWLLFNTAEDPYEQANHVYNTSFQAQKERCHERLARWIEETGDAFELPDIILDG